MADLGILFSAPMVRALLDGTKTQTRRVIEPYEVSLHPLKGSKPMPKNLIQIKLPARLGGYIKGPVFNPRYAVGDRLYVREAWRALRVYDRTKPRDIPAGTICLFEATPPEPSDFDQLSGRLRPSLFMPRWATRLTLIVTGVRVQRLQEISEADAVAEGVVGYHDEAGLWFSARDAYAILWDSLNDDPRRPGCAWRHDPWIVAYSFSVHPGNIDQVTA